MEPEIDITVDPLGPDVCPECGQPTWKHDREIKHYICINDECGWVEDAAEESNWTKLLRLVRIKK